MGNADVPTERLPLVHSIEPIMTVKVGRSACPYHHLKPPPPPMPYICRNANTWAPETRRDVYRG